MKIAIVDMLFNWPPDGGARVDILETAKVMRDLGHDVKLFFPHFETPYFPRGRITEDPGIPYEIIPFNYLTFIPLLIKKRFLNRVKKFAPDIVFIGDSYFLKPHLISVFSGKYKIIARFFAYELLCPSYSSMCRNERTCEFNYLKNPEICMNCALKDMQGDLMSFRLNHWIHDFLISRGFSSNFHDFTLNCIKKLNHIIVYNDFTKEMFLPYNKNVRVIPGGINLESMASEDTENEPFTVSKKIILMTGRIDDYRKGFKTLNLAGEILSKKRDDFEIWATSPYVESKGDYVHFTGWLPHQELLRLYQKAYLCVFPPIWPEAFGIVAVEAMAAGKPVIASRVGGLQGIVVPEKTGFLFSPGDHHELAGYIEKLLDDPELAKKMGAAGKKRVEEHYTWENIVKTHYADILSP